uniref:Uncharacterized protein n=1 Tax=viral metagenome TaxID=1070528 RepID=A0A6C0J5G9_9ZZZZ
MNNNINKNLLNCFKPTQNNPFMNYLNLGTPTNKTEACNVSKKKIEKTFYEGSMLTPHELRIKDNFIEQYETKTVTTVVNDQSAYAKFLFPNTARCRDDGYLCKINNDVSSRNDRSVIISDNYRPKYLDIYGVYESYK